MNKKIPKKLLSGAVAAALALALLPASALAAGSEYTAAGATKLTFSNSGITAKDGDYTGYKIDGTDLTIQSSGIYLVSGSCADGSIKIKKGTTGVTLVLNGLTLTSSDTAPIACNKSTEVTIVAAGGTANTLTDSAQNNDDNYPDNEDAENAVIKCKDGSQVTLCGSGTLNVVANGKNGIKSGATTDIEGEASLTIRDLKLNITASVNDAINAEQLLNIESGTLTISAADDAIHCDYVMNVGADGTSGPAINITDCYEGIEAATLNILSGDIDITATDDCLNAANSDLSGYRFSMTISGGAVNAYTSGGDGFDSNGDLTITGGSVTVWTAGTADNQPLDADGTLTVSGGTILAAGGSAGMGVKTTASQPYVAFGSSGGIGRGPMGGGSTSTLIAKGGSFSIKDSSGNTVYSGSAVCNASYLFFSSSKLTSGGSYSLYSGSSSAATAAAQMGASSSGAMGGGQRPGNGRQPGTSGGQQPAAPGNTGTQPPALPDGSNGSQQPSGTTPLQQSNSFSDVSSGDWFYEAIRYVTENGLMNGTGSGTFAPNATITRGMLVTILYRLDGEPAVSGSRPFTDIPSGSYCEKAATWAAANGSGLINGTAGGTLAPKGTATRAQTAMILMRFCRKAA